MTDADDMESRLLNLANRTSILVRLSRQDAALAAINEGLLLSNQFGLVSWEFSFLCQMCQMLDPSLFPVDYERYIKRLIALAVEHAETLTADETYAASGRMLEGFIGNVHEPIKSELTRRFSSVRASYYQTDVDNLYYAPPIQVDWPAKMTVKYRSLMEAAHGSSHFDGDEVNITALRDELLQAVSQLKLKAGRKRMIKTEIQRYAVMAGLLYGQSGVVLAGATSLMREPMSSFTTYDQVCAAQAILWMVQQITPEEDRNTVSLYQASVMKAVRKVTWNSLKSVFDHQVPRFISQNLTDIFPLIGSYVDFLALRPATVRQAVSMIALFQGALITIASRLSTNQNQRSAEIDFFAHELDSLLRYESLGGYEPETAGDPLILRPRQSAPPINGSGAGERTFDGDEEDRGYSDVNFNITVEDVATPRPVELQSLRTTLSADEAVILLFLSERFLYAAIVQSKVPTRLVRIAERRRILEESRDLEYALKSGNDRFLLKGSDFSFLHNIVLAPALDGLRREVNRLTFIAPQLRLPFHLAYNSDACKYLIGRYTINYAHSVDLYARTFASIDEGTALLLDGSAATPAVLHSVADELMGIREALSARFNIEGPYRTRREALSSTQKVALIHYAGHMRTDPSAARWKLQLDDGGIRPAELLSRIDANTGTVSLISCFSADQQGDRPELFGLSAVLAAAGVRNFVGCLWAIPDNAAAAISCSMYNKWTTESASMPDAVRDATREWRSWPPAVWGSVVCYGSRIGIDHDGRG